MGDYFETCFWDVDIDSQQAKNQYALFEKLDQFDVFLPFINIRSDNRTMFLCVISYCESEDDIEEADRLFNKIMELADKCGDVGELECAGADISEENIRTIFNLEGKGRRDNKEKFNI